MNTRTTFFLRCLLLLASLASLEAKAKTLSVSNTQHKSITNSLRGHERELIITSKEPQATSKIIGGTDASNNSLDNRHPYFALMNDEGLCGAVLISKRFVLSAAHCVGGDDDFEIGITERKPYYSALLLESDSGGTEFAWSRLAVHPDYNRRSVDSDIAIFELAEDVPDSLSYIKLEKEEVTVAGTPLSVIGFGDTNPGDRTEISLNLLETTVDYVPTVDCIRQMRAAGAFGPITPTMLCAFEEGQDSCQGDSGGPLFLKGDTPLEDSLVGLVSWGYECAGDTPGVYTRISYFYDWIVETMCLMNQAGVPDYVDCNNIVATGEETTISGTDTSFNDDGNDFFNIDDWFSGDWFGSDDENADDDGNDWFASDWFGSDDENADDDDDGNDLFASDWFGSDDENADDANGDDDDWWGLCDDDSWFADACDAVGTWADDAATWWDGLWGN